MSNDIDGHNGDDGAKLWGSMWKEKKYANLDGRYIFEPIACYNWDSEGFENLYSPL